MCRFKVFLFSLLHNLEEGDSYFWIISFFKLKSKWISFYKSKYLCFDFFPIIIFDPNSNSFPFFFPFIPFHPICWMFVRFTEKKIRFARHFGKEIEHILISKWIKSKKWWIKKEIRREKVNTEGSEMNAKRKKKLQKSLFVI